MSYDLSDFKEDVETLADTIENNQIRSPDPIVELRQMGDVRGVFEGPGGAVSAEAKINTAIKHAAREDSNPSRTTQVLRDEVLPAVEKAIE